MSNYQTITQSICYVDDLGFDRKEEVGMEFSPNGLTSKGTFILYEFPSDAEEEVINEYQANWAIEHRFEDFGNQISNWSEFQSFINDIKSTHVGEVCEALNFLQGNDFSSTVIYAHDLPLIKDYEIWKIQQQQQMLNNAIAQAATPAPTTFKI